MIIIIVVASAVLSLSAMGFQLRRRHQPPPMDSRFLVKFGLKPGERHGDVWRGVNSSGIRTILTVTTSGDLVMSPEESPGEPVRIRRNDVKVVVGESVAAQGPVMPSLTELTLALPDQLPLVILVDSVAAPAIKRWADSHS